MAASAYQPIVVPGHYDPMFKVDVLLHAPLREHKESSDDLKVNIMALCLQLDTLCKQELTPHPSLKSDHGKICSTFKDKAIVVFRNLQQTLSKFHNTACTETYFQTGIEQLFPCVGNLMTSPDNLTMKLKKTHIDNYLKQMSHLHHILSLSRQIHSDITHNAGCKYLAHQLAVLYQAISSVPSGRESLSSHRNNIEENFKALQHSIDNISGDGDEEELQSEVRNCLLQPSIHFLREKKPTTYGGSENPGYFVRQAIDFLLCV